MTDCGLTDDKCNGHISPTTTTERQLEDRSLSSDDTVFLDLPLPPVPARAVEIHNVDVHSAIAAAALHYSRMDEFDIPLPRKSCERESLSSHSSEGAGSPNDLNDDRLTPLMIADDDASKWSTSDEESSYYRERLSMFRSESLTPRIFENNLADSSYQHHRSADDCLDAHRKGKFMVFYAILHVIRNIGDYRLLRLVYNYS